MYCEQCGAKLEDGARFCAVCGAAMGSVAEPAIQVEDSFAQDQAAAPKKYRKPVMVIAAILIAIIAVIAGVKWYLESRPVTVNLDDYVTVTCSGYDTMGTAEVTIDSEAFLADYGDKIKLRSEYSSQSDYLLTWYPSFADALLSDSILEDISLDQDEDLSNGDILTVLWKVDEASAEALFNIELEYGNATYTVETLTPVEVVDLFEGVEVQFYGTSPAATAEVVSSNKWLDASDYSLSQSAYLQIGDVIEITISSSAANALLESNHIVPEARTKEVTVSGVAYYATALADIPDDAIATMRAQTEAKFEEELIYLEDYEPQLQSMDYLGCYFLSQSTNSWYSENRFGLVYKATVELQGAVYTAYWYCYFIDAIVLADGSFSIDYPDYEITVVCAPVKVTNSNGSTYTLYLPGYESLEDLYKNEISRLETYYSIESSVAES